MRPRSGASASVRALFFLRTQYSLSSSLAAAATALAGLLLRDLLALFSRFGKPDRDGLLATFDCTAFATLSAFQLATFKFVHFALYVCGSAG